MNLKRLAALGLMIVMTLSLAACGGKGKEEEETENIGVAVQVETVLPDTIYAENKVSGKVESDNETTITINSPAKCTAVYAQAGDQVQAGDIICTLDLGSALASYNAARAGYEAALQSYQDQQGILSKQVNLAKDNAANTRALFEIGAASKLEVEQAELAYQSALAGMNSGLAQLEAGMQNAKSGLEQMDIVMEHVDPSGNVVADISGTLAVMTAVEGAYISVGSPLVVIDGADQMRVTVAVSEAVVPKLSIGGEADVFVSAVGKSFAATIRSVERTASAQTKLYNVVLTVPADVTGLLTGMFADVTFHTDVSENTIVIPTEAILTSGSTRYVYVVEDNTAHYVEVEVGLTGSGVTEILSGLAEGQQLVTVGQSYLGDGDPVRIVTVEG